MELYRRSYDHHCPQNIVSFFFYYGDPRSGKFCGLPIKWQYDKKPIPSCTHQIRLVYPKWRYIRPLLMIQSQILSYWAFKLLHPMLSHISSLFHVPHLRLRFTSVLLRLFFFLGSGRSKKWQSVSVLDLRYPWFSRQVSSLNLWSPRGAMNSKF